MTTTGRATQTPTNPGTEADTGGCYTPIPEPNTGTILSPEIENICQCPAEVPGNAQDIYIQRIANPLTGETRPQMTDLDHTEAGLATTPAFRNPMGPELVGIASLLYNKGYRYICRDSDPAPHAFAPDATARIVAMTSTGTPAATPAAAGSAAAALTITRTDGTVEPTAFESCNTDRASDTSNKEVTTGLTDAEIAYIQEKFLANHQDISSIQIGCRNSNIRGLTTLSITRSITVLGPIIGRTQLLEGSASTPDSISYDIEHPERIPASLGATPVERLSAAMKVKTELEKILATNPNVQTQIGRREADEDRERADDKQDVMVAVFLLMAYQALRQIWNDGKSLYRWIRWGRVKTTDFRAFVQGLLKKNSNYEVVGRMDEAREAWRQADTEGFRGVIVNLATGEGKDEFAKAMIILKEREALNIGNARADSVVPEEFRNAPVYRINAAEFQENTNLRGQVADKLAEIIKKARRGPVIYIISEIDQVFKAGGSSSGDSEKVANMLLNILEDEVIRHNLMLIGTTSRGDDMLTQHPDLERRFNWPDLHTYLLDEIKNIINNGPTRTTYETRYGVQISPEVVDAATRLAVKFYRSPFWSLRVALGRNIPRFDAIKKVLEDAAKLAKREGTTNVTVDQVRRATEARYRVQISQERMNELLRVENMNTLDPNRYEVRSATAPEGQTAATNANPVLDEMVRRILTGSRDISPTVMMYVLKYKNSHPGADPTRLTDAEVRAAVEAMARGDRPDAPSRGGNEPPQGGTPPEGTSGAAGGGDAAAGGGGTPSGSATGGSTAAHYEITYDPAYLNGIPSYSDPDSREYYVAPPAAQTDRVRPLVTDGLGSRTWSAVQGAGRSVAETARGIGETVFGPQAVGVGAAGSGNAGIPTDQYAFRAYEGAPDPIVMLPPAESGGLSVSDLQARINASLTGAGAVPEIIPWNQALVEGVNGVALVGALAHVTAEWCIEHNCGPYITTLASLGVPHVATSAIANWNVANPSVFLDRTVGITSLRSLVQGVGMAVPYMEGYRAYVAPAIANILRRVFGDNVGDVAGTVLTSTPTVLGAGAGLSWFNGRLLQAIMQKAATGYALGSLTQGELSLVRTLMPTTGMTAEGLAANIEARAAAGLATEGATVLTTFDIGVLTASAALQVIGWGLLAYQMAPFVAVDMATAINPEQFESNMMDIRALRAFRANEQWGATDIALAAWARDLNPIDDIDELDNVDGLTMDRARLYMNTQYMNQNIDAREYVMGLMKIKTLEYAQETLADGPAQDTESFTQNVLLKMQDFVAQLDRPPEFPGEEHYLAQQVENKMKEGKSREEIIAYLMGTDLPDNYYTRSFDDIFGTRLSREESEALIEKVQVRMLQFALLHVENLAPPFEDGPFRGEHLANGMDPINTDLRAGFACYVEDYSGCNPVYLNAVPQAYALRGALGVDGVFMDETTLFGKFLEETHTIEDVTEFHRATLMERMAKLSLLGRINNNVIPSRTLIVDEESGTTLEFEVTEQDIVSGLVIPLSDGTFLVNTEGDIGRTLRGEADADANTEAAG